MTVDWVGSEERSEKHALVDVLRRNPRFILRGLPGMGKTAAMRQLAAWLATQQGAPVPIPVNLRRLAQDATEPAHVTVSALIREAATRSVAQPTAGVEYLLRDALRTGRAILLLDGFDETFQMASLVAVGLRDVPDAIHPGVRRRRRHARHRASCCGASRAAERRTRGSVTHGFAGVPDCRGGGAQGAGRGTARCLGARPRAGRASPLAISRGEWSVPLLATLATLQPCSAEHVDEDPFHLLNAVVERSIRSWSGRYDELEHRDLDRAFDPRMLMTGFTVIGRLLNSTTVVTAEHAVVAVSSRLGPWNLPRVREDAIARMVVDFWDERAGTFISVDGRLEPRSQQFAELGDARAVLTLDSAEEQRAWLTDVLDQPTKHAAAALVTSASAQLARHLLEHAGRSAEPARRARAAGWVAATAQQWRHLEPADVKALLAALTEAAGEGLPTDEEHAGTDLRRKLDGHRDRGGPGWLYVVAAALLSLPTPAREHRASLLGTLPLTAPQGQIRDALMALTGARDDLRALSQDEHRTVATALAQIPPDESPAAPAAAMSAASQRPPRMLPGLHQDAILSTRHAEQLTDPQIQTLFRIAWHSPMRTYELVSRDLKAAGYKDRNPHRLRVPRLSMDFTPELTELAGFGWLTRHVLAMGLGGGDLSSSGRWRLTALADLVAALNWNAMLFGDLSDLQPVPHGAASAFIRAGMHRAGLDPGQVAETVQHLVQHPDRDALASTLYAPRLLPSHQSDRLPAKTAGALVDVLLSPVGWLSDSGRDFLLAHGADEGVHAMCRTRLSEELEWAARLNVAVALLTTSPSSAKDLEALAAGPAAERYAAAVVMTSDDFHVDLRICSSGCAETPTRRCGKALGRRAPRSSPRSRSGGPAPPAGTPTRWTARTVSVAAAVPSSAFATFRRAWADQSREQLCGDEGRGSPVDQTAR